MYPVNDTMLTRINKAIVAKRVAQDTTRLILFFVVCIVGIIVAEAREYTVVVLIALGWTFIVVNLLANYISKRYTMSNIRPTSELAIRNAEDDPKLSTITVQELADYIKSEYLKEAMSVLYIKPLETVVNNQSMIKIDWLGFQRTVFEGLMDMKYRIPQLAAFVQNDFAAMLADGMTTRDEIIKARSEVVSVFDKFIADIEMYRAQVNMVLTHHSIPLGTRNP